MIPYLELGPWALGPFRVYPFGILVGAALLTWLLLVIRRARAAGLEPRRAVWLLEWMLLAGLVGAPLLPAMIEGRIRFSSFGATFAALTGAAVFFWRDRIARCRWREYLDALAWAAPFGWTWLRLGCFLQHDHPGKRTAAWIGVAYPGGARYDLGLLEMLVVAVGAAIFLVLGRRPRAPGFYASWLVWCGPLRALLELARDDAPRYYGLASGEWAAALLTVAGLALVWLSRRAGRLLHS